MSEVATSAWEDAAAGVVGVEGVREMRGSTLALLPSFNLPLLAFTLPLPHPQLPPPLPLLPLLLLFVLLISLTDVAPAQWTSDFTGDVAAFLIKSLLSLLSYPLF